MCSDITSTQDQQQDQQHGWLMLLLLPELQDYTMWICDVDYYNVK